MLLVIVTIVMLVTIHELGHYLTALSLGVGVQEFCVGFGPKLFATRIGETRFTLRLILLGGYVDPVDWNDIEDIPDDMELVERKLIIDKKRWLSNQPLWERLAIVIMGPAVNVGLCVLLLSFTGLASKSQGWRDVVAATIHTESREAVLGISITHDNILSDIETSFQLGLVPYLRHLAIVSLWLGGFNMFR